MTKSVWLRKDIRGNVRRIWCDILLVTDLGQYKILAYLPGRTPAVRYVKASSVEKGK